MTYYICANVICQVQSTKVAHIPAAIIALEVAIKVHEAAEAKRRENPGPVVEVEGDSVMLRHRAGPLIYLLNISAQAGKDVVWGV
ncbi:MAG: DUF1840 family protein [Comamonadaceae bacterium]|nr:DUF1840 family protein [Comamonadaceae bacterium]